MINYNDGKWHGWNGGECPVHPDTMVECVWHKRTTTSKAEDFIWIGGDTYSIIAFRVVKEYKEPVEPREFWIDAFSMYATDEPDHVASYYIHVREVLE